MKHAVHTLAGVLIVLCVMLVACSQSANLPPEDVAELPTSTPTSASTAPAPADETNTDTDTAPAPADETETDTAPVPADETETDTAPAPADETEPGDMLLPGEGITVTMARATWDTGWFQAEVFSLLLNELGYSVAEPETMENSEFYQAVADGDVLFWANGWFPLHNAFVETDGVQGKVEAVGFEVRAGALQGYLIDKKTADVLGITSLEDMTKPEVIEAFDADGNGKADLVGCDEGWGCAEIIEHHLDEYELRESVEHIQGSYSALMGETIARYERGNPIFFYTWTPNWTVNKLVPGEDVVWIEVPFSSLPEEQQGMEEFTTGRGIEGCVNDPCNMGFPPNDIRVVANKEFLEANPVVRRLFEQVEIPLRDIADQNARMFDGENSDEDIQHHAERWIAQNRDLVDRWLDDARLAK